MPETIDVAPDLQLTTRPARQPAVADPAEPPQGTGEPVNERTFRQTMSRFPTFVTVITAAGRTGPVGCTATSVLSLSLRPPTLVVSLRSTGKTLDDVLTAGRFAVNVLSWHQRELAQHFATGDPRHRFDHVPHTRWDGVPVLEDTSATVVCRLGYTMPVLDHTLLFGTVAFTRACQQEPPVVLLDGRSHAVDETGQVLP
ncbi:flavin reductase [Streptomyces sp. 3MP-14]|uniref:Flavin reductase n=1 Tax=Streptomyces mimosae TaxID=2586635 RepID=A0A5N6A0L5_9ACTN|nr:MULTISPECIES: flavin reductase family protein [Streptomyces]KAB8161593.1 flavin reductase [Streptomyces mimosae]KAB8173470.1 flavin reductase [Streptomyces sp. 3MP-14]